MKPQKFHGSTSREVLRKVRQALGADALILANRPVAGGIEITALPGNALVADIGVPVPSRAAAPADGDGIVQQMMREMRTLKSSMQRELSGIAWSDLMRRDPERAAVMQLLLESGFSPALSRELLAATPAKHDANEVHKAVGTEIGRRLQLADGEALVTDGGVYALIGPTGVGKTTTTAKLAARCVVRHGAGQLALLTTDTYRIAAHDQLRVYGKILGVPVHMVKEPADLRMTLAELRGKKTVLIDTIGMSQRDQMVAEQAALLASGGAQVKRLLLLNATCNAATLDDVVGAYSRGGVHGCIVTKLDEAASVAPVLDSLIRHRLAVHYVTNGQRVPEDLHLPNRAYLLHRAMRALPAGSAHGLRDEEFALAMTAAAPGVAHA